MERLTRKFVQKINGRNEIDVVLPAERTVQEAVNRLAEFEDKIENGTLVETKIVTGFVNSFINYLLKSEAECGDTERENIEACIYQEIFQVFGRKVEKQLGIKVFGEDGENGN